MLQNNGVIIKFLLLFADEAQEAEAIQVLNAILELREQQAVQNASTMCKIYFTVAMLYCVLQQPNQVRIHENKQIV